MDADILCVDVREYAAHICVAIFFDAAQTGFATREDFIGTQAASTIHSSREQFIVMRAHTI
jgi:hypothetical protein